MNCDCGKYKYDEGIFVYRDYWKFKKNIFMGKLYECPYCGTLWAEYMTGHGWTMYYKKKKDSIFENESIEVSSDDLITSWDETEEEEWEDLIKKLPIKDKYRIGKIIIPSDIMAVLCYLLKDVKNIKKWLFTSCAWYTGDETPIQLMSKNSGENIVRLILLKYITRDDLKE